MTRTLSREYVQQFATNVVDRILNTYDLYSGQTVKLPVGRYIPSVCEAMTTILLERGFDVQVEYPHADLNHCRIFYLTYVGNRVGRSTLPQILSLMQMPSLQLTYHAERLDRIDTLSRFTTMLDKK